MHIPVRVPLTRESMRIPLDTSRHRLFSLVLACALGGCGNRPTDDLLRAHVPSLRVTSSDTFLVSAFEWAKQTSASYVGRDTDPVGPWYEASLPTREAFCIRDVAHQSIGAELLGYGKQNLNMFRRFVENISESKDYCTHWEINRYNKPAPVDYASDEDFWYNLNANFDIIDASYKLYLWTGNRTYIDDPQFDRFMQLSLNEYIERWQLQADRIMARPAFLNRRPGTRRYAKSRGIPSYDEGQDDLVMSGDLLGMIYNGFITYAKVLGARDDSARSARYLTRASAYGRLLDSLWWDPGTQSYFAFYKTDHTFAPAGIGGSEFLLWYNAIRDPRRIVSALHQLRESQIEVLSYLPMLFYRYGFNQDAYDFLRKIMADPRRQYPEAASGTVEGIVRGLMGVEPSAATQVVTTTPHLTSRTAWIAAEGIPIFSGAISVRHTALSRTDFANQSDRTLRWRAQFPGACTRVEVDGRSIAAAPSVDAVGNAFCYVDVHVAAHAQMRAEVRRP